MTPRRRNFNELTEAIDSDPVRRARVERHKEAIYEALRLAALRESCGLTQENLATELGVSQVNVSRVERADDVYLSTLCNYVNALGGRLELRAVFPDHVVKLDHPQTNPDDSRRR